MTPITIQDKMKVLDNMDISYAKNFNSLYILMNFIFLYLNSPLECISRVTNRAILACKNAFVDEKINNILIQKFHGQIKQYYITLMKQ